MGDPNVVFLYRCGLSSIKNILAGELPNCEIDLARLYQAILKNVPDTEFVRFFDDYPDLKYYVIDASEEE